VRVIAEQFGVAVGTVMRCRPFEAVAAVAAVAG
jgi:hypothetical protein